MTFAAVAETHISERCAQEVCCVIFNELSAHGVFPDANAFSAALDKAMEDIRPIVADFIAEAGGGRAGDPVRVGDVLVSKDGKRRTVERIEDGHLYVRTRCGGNGMIYPTSLHRYRVERP